MEHENLIAGGGLDDAAAYRVRDDLAVVSTVDVFTPIVDDAYTYGAISAANSLSDIYAMGATPLMALAVGGFPKDKLPLEVMSAILLGGVEKAAEAGIPIAGGHTIENPEPIYGLSVIGQVHPDEVVRNSGGRPGDALILTKPLGTGLVCTAHRAEEARDEWMDAATSAMLSLNRSAAEAMQRHGVTACTDITGFGLLVHGHEMAEASGCAMDIAADSVPLLPGALECLRADMAPGGLYRNLDHARKFSEWSDSAEEATKIMADPQTSGGLLISVPEENASALLDDLAGSLPEGTFGMVGELADGEPGRVRVI